MTSYLVVKLLKSSFVPLNSMTYGDVEIRNSKNESEKEKMALHESMSSFFLDIDINDCHRIAIVIDSKTNCFLKEADAKFEEVIDICNLNYLTNENTLYPAGYYCNLNDLSFNPILKNKEVNDLTLGSKFKIRYFMYEAANNDQFILSGKNNEVINAYIRAANWIRKAETENILYLKFLYKWISLETLCKTKEYENILPKLRLVLGFPTNNSNIYFDNSLLLELKDSIQYQFWKHKIEKILDNARNYRNSVVHNGFRDIDIDHKKLQQFIKVMDFIIPNLAEYYKQTISLGIEKLKETWEFIPLLVSENKNFKNYTFKTLFYFFEHDDDLMNIE